MRRTFCVLLALLLAAGLTGCAGESNTPRAQASRALGVDLTGGTLLAGSDSHDGFLGDGLTFVALQFSDDRVARELENREGWHPLPLSRTVTALAYGLEEGDRGWGPYVTGEDGQALIPPVENGRYYFLDRHSDAGRGEEDVLERGSFNFTLALYDIDRDILYYAKMDT